MPSEYDTREEDLEIHEYNAKTRQRDFFKTANGSLGLGPGDLEVGDKSVVPFGASRPWILREHAEADGSSEVDHTLIGSAVVPGFMSGSWMRLVQDEATDYRIK